MRWCGLLKFLLSAIKQEHVPDVRPDRSEVKGFDSGKLKHVETVVKNAVPSKDGKYVSFEQSAFAQHVA